MAALKKSNKPVTKEETMQEKIRRVREAEYKRKHKDQAWVEQYLKENEIAPLSLVEGIPTITPVNSKWKDRPKSNIIKWFMETSGRTSEEVSNGLDCNDAYFNNKLYRDSFSLEDILIAAYICGYAVTFTSINTDIDKRSTYQIDTQDYFRATDAEALQRLWTYEKDLRERKKEQYKILKAQLERMKDEFGFED